MERVIRGRSFTLSKTFTSDGTPTTPTGTPTVTITRLSDGTTVPAGSVGGSGTGPYTVTVPASANTLLDTLDVTWTATIGGEAQTYEDTVEVAGDVFFSIAEARTLAPLNNTTTYTTAAITDMRTTVEQAIEDACGVAFVPRYRLETITQELTPVRLQPKLRTVRSLTANGTVYTSDQIAALTATSDGLLYLTTGTSWRISDSGWGTGYGRMLTATVGYEHGYDTTPARVRRAAILLARAWLVTGPIDDRASTFTSADSGGTYSLVTPGRGGSLFGVPEVDVIVQQYGMIGVA